MSQIGFDPSLHLASQIFLRENVRSVLEELGSWLEKSGFRAHFPVEVRFVKADDLLISPASGRDSCYINIVMYRSESTSVT